MRTPLGRGSDKVVQSSSRLSTLARVLATSQQQQLARELAAVIRETARDPDALEDQLDVLSSFFRVRELALTRAGEEVHFISRRLIPEYVARLPEGSECDAIRALFEYERDGVAQSLTTRYHNASAHFPSPPKQFARRQEPRLLLACARSFLRFDHDDSIDAMHGSTRRGDRVEVPADVDQLSPLASVLWTQTLEEQQDRLNAIQEGTVLLRDQDEMLELLVRITNAAESTLHALDQTALERWFTDPRLERYVHAQLERARGGEVRVERLRVVRQADLDEPRLRNLLREFVRLHEEAGATLLLCHENDLRGLNTSFLRGPNPDTADRTIMVLADSETRPTSLVSELDDDGYVMQSTLYLRSLTQIRRYYRDLKRITEYLENGGQDVSAVLASHDDPPLSQTPAEGSTRPGWRFGPPVL